MVLNDYDKILTRNFFNDRSEKTTEEILNELMTEFNFLGYKGNIKKILEARRLAWTLEPYDETEVEIEDKIIPAEFSEDAIDMYYFHREEIRKQEYKQKSVTVNIDKEECFGIALEGDYHLGHEFSDWFLIKKNMTKILNHPNLFSINTGDILSNEANHPSSKNRFPVKELPLSDQKKMAKWVFSEYGEKMLAIVMGNHDEKSLITEDYDICEELAPYIKGAYLGFSGDVIINLNGVRYNIFLTHKGKGFSLYNPLHGGIRVAKELFDPNIDAVVFGHIHEPTAYIDIPLGRNNGRMMAIRAATYMRDATYARAAGYIINKTDMDVPVLVLHPDQKKIVLIKGIDESTIYIDGYNDKLRNLRK